MREIENFVYQLQQVPSGLENLIQAALLRWRRQRRSRFHDLRKTEHGVERGAQLMAHLGKKRRFCQAGFLRRGLGVLQIRFDLLAHGVVGADQQIADYFAEIIAQRRDRHDSRKAGAVLANIGQFIGIFDPARRLERQRLEAWGNGGGELDAKRRGACNHFLRIMHVARAYLVYDFGREITQHALGADIEQLDDALLIGGDDREVGTG